MILFQIGTFLLEAARCCLLFAVIRNKGKKQGERKKEIVFCTCISIIFGAAAIYSFRTGAELYANQRLLICCAVVAVIGCLGYRIKFCSLFFELLFLDEWITMADLFLQAIIFWVLRIWQFSEPDILIRGTWQHGIYLLILVGMLFSFRQKILDWAEWLTQIKKQWKVPALLVFTIILIYFQRVYILAVTRAYMANWLFFWLVCFCVVLAGLLYEQRLKSQERDRLQEVKIQMLEKNYQQAVQQYKEKATLLHDEKHHMRVIQEMLKRGEADAAKIYADDVSDSLQKSERRIWSGNQMIDLILNMKYAEMKQEGIILEASFSGMEELKLSEKEISILFFNLLDNAIEANKKISENQKKWVQLKGEKKGSQFFLQIENPYAGNIVWSNGLPVSTKKEKDLHGFGLESVKAMAEERQGVMELEDKDGKFCVSLLLNQV